MSQHILPSDINKNLHQVLMRAEDKYLNKLVEGGRNGINLNQNLLFTTTFATLGTIATMVWAPAFAAPLLPVAAPLLIAGLVGTAVLGQINKYQAKKEQENVVKEFCKKEGIDYKNILDDSTLTGFKYSFLNKVINETHITPYMNKEEIVNVIDKKSNEAVNDTLKNKILNATTSLFENVSSIQERIQNSAKAFIQGYQSAQKEFSKDLPSKPAPK